MVKFPWLPLVTLTHITQRKIDSWSEIWHLPACTHLYACCTQIDGPDHCSYLFASWYENITVAIFSHFWSPSLRNHLTFRNRTIHTLRSKFSSIVLIILEIPRNWRILGELMKNGSKNAREAPFRVFITLGGQVFRNLSVTVILGDIHSRRIHSKEHRSEKWRQQCTIWIQWLRDCSRFVRRQSSGMWICQQWNTNSCNDVFQWSQYLQLLWRLLHRFVFAF